MAIEAREFTEKDELIGKFYTIRAGLSVIAEETQKIKEAEKNLYQREEENRRLNEKTLSENDQLRKEYSYKKKSLENEEYEVKRKINSKEKDFKEKYESKRNHVDLFALEAWKIALGVAISIFVAIIVLAWGVSAELPEKDIIADWLLPANFITAIAVFFIVKWAVNKSRDTKALNEAEKYRANSEELKEIKRLNARLDEIHREQKELKEPIDDTSNINKYAGEIESLKWNLSNQVIPASTTRAIEVRKALKAYTGDILTEDDWSNVDLLIFYLNTGRADSLKEALLLVDQQRQTEQITRAIRTAAGYICNTIEDNTYRLSRVMNNCFLNLSNQIHQNHLETVGMIEQGQNQIYNAINSIGKSINSGIDSLNSNLESQGKLLADAQEINASLLRQAKLGSDELMHELKYNQKYW